MICMRRLQSGKEISKQGRLMLSAGKPLETPGRKSQSPKVPCRECTARQGVFMWHGRGEEENGDQGKMMGGTGRDDASPQGGRENQHQIIQHVSITHWCIHNPMQNPLIRLNGRKFRSTPWTVEVVTPRIRAPLDLTRSTTRK